MTVIAATMIHTPTAASAAHAVAVIVTHSSMIHPILAPSQNE